MRSLPALLAVLLLAGCATSTAQPGATTATTGPTAAAHPSPAGSQDALDEFIAHGRTALTEMRDRMGVVMAGADAEDAPKVRSSTPAVHALVETEFAWLDGHPPLPCYASAHAAWRAQFAALKVLATSLDEWAAAYPNNADALRSAVDQDFDVWAELAKKFTDVAAGTDRTSCP